MIVCTCVGIRMVTQKLPQEPKGVCTKKIYDLYIDYRDTDIKNSGVRKDNHIYYFRSKKHTWVEGLMFAKPCLCGSFIHSTKRHSDCPLNVRYADAK